MTQFSEIGGTSRIHVLQFLPLLRKRGIVCDSRHFYSDRFYRIMFDLVKIGRFDKSINFVFYVSLGMLKKLWYIWLARNYDAVFLQREVFPLLWRWLLKISNPRIIYEIEDAVFEINPIYRKRGLIYFTAVNYQAKLISKMIQQAVWVIAENEHLAEYSRKFNQNVTIISCPIDTNYFVPGLSKSGDVVTIGWVGSPLTTYLLKELNPVFTRLGKRYGDKIRLMVIGAASDYVVKGVSLIKKNWSLATQIADLQQFDIGLMPLDDTPFNKGRLGGKMMQYMSLGLPVVASNVGLNSMVVKDDFNGYLAGDIDEWVAKLSLLIENRELREQLGKNGRIEVVKKYDIDKQAYVIYEIINKVCHLDF